MNAIRVFLGVAFVVALHAAAQVKFDGKWEFNPSLSKNVGMMAQMKLRSTVKQSGDEMVITSVSSFSGSGEQTSELRFDLTGKPITNKAPMEAPADTVTKWDGNRLITTWTSEGSVAGTKSVRTETRSLSDDARTMTVESKRGSSSAIVMVYERK
jgi:hypothetical protein